MNHKQSKVTAATNADKMDFKLEMTMPSCWRSTQELRDIKCQMVLKEEARQIPNNNTLKWGTTKLKNKL